MTTAEVPTSSTTLRLLGAVNEAAIAFEDEATPSWEARAVAEAVTAWAAYALETPALHLQDVLLATYKADKAAVAYLNAPVHFVHSHLEVVRLANELVATVMNHDDLIGA